MLWDPQDVFARRVDGGCGDAKSGHAVHGLCERFFPWHGTHWQVGGGEGRVHSAHEVRVRQVHCGCWVIGSCAGMQSVQCWFFQSHDVKFVDSDR